MKSIYLAGGMENNWRYNFIQNSSEWVVYDPCKHDLKNSKNYTSWDIKAIEKSNIILGYIEKDNISGYGLCVEIGYGKALGKIIIWVEEDRGGERNKYFAMCRELANYVFYDINEAFEFIDRNVMVL